MKFDSTNLLNILNSEIKFAGGIRLEGPNVKKTEPKSEEEKEKLFQQALTMLSKNDKNGLSILTSIGVKYLQRNIGRYSYITFDYKGEFYKYRLINNTMLKPPRPNPDSIIAIEKPVHKAQMRETITYDENGNATKTEYENNVKTRVTVTSPDGKLIREEQYDESGENLVQERNYSDGVLSEEINYKDGKKVSEKHYDSQGLKKEIEFVTYKGEQCPSREINYSFGNVASSIKEYVYNENEKENYIIYRDGNGVKLREEHPDEDNNLRVVVSFDKDGNKTTAENYRLDDNFRLSDVKYDKNGNEIEKNEYFESGDVERKNTRYNESGQIIQETIYNQDGSFKVTNYDNSGRVISEETTTKKGEFEAYDYQYSTDENGNTVVTMRKRGEADFTEKVYVDGELYEQKTYEYDSSNRLSLITVKDSEGKLIQTEKYNYETNRIYIDTYEGNRQTSSEVLNVENKLPIYRMEYFADGSRNWYGYDENGKLKSAVITSADGSEKIQFYDENGKLKQENITTEDGSKKIQTYDEEGRLASEQSSKNGVTTKIVYKYEDDCRKETVYINDVKQSETTIYTNDEKVDKVVVNYDENGNTTETIEYRKDGSVCTTNENADGNTVETVRDTEGVVTQTTYTQWGKLVKAWDKDGNEIRNELYDSDGNQYWSDDNGNRVTLTFDSDGNRIETTTDKSSGEVLATLVTDAEGNLIRETKINDDGNTVETVRDEDGVVTQTTYTQWGKLVKSWDKDGNQIRNELYDSDGNQYWSDDNGNRVTLTFDSDGNRVETTTDKSSGEVLATLVTDAEGNLIRETKINDDGNTVETVRDEDGIVTQTTYTQWGKLVKAWDKDGNQIRNELYDSDGNQYWSDDNGNKVTLTFDSDGNRIETTTDKAGKTLSKRTYKEDGSSKEVFYDSQNREIKQKNYNANGVHIGTVEFEYDKSGAVSCKVYKHADDSIYRIERVDSANSQSIVDIYKDGKKVSDETYKWSPWRLSVKNEYDENGLVTKTTKYNDDGKTVSEVVEYTYENGVKTVETTCDKDGKLLSKTTFNANGSKTTETFGADGNVIKTETTDASNKKLSERVYKEDGSSKEVFYDSKGVVVQEKNYSAEGVCTSNITFEYDKSGSVSCKVYKDTNDNITRKEYIDSANSQSRVENYKDGKKVSDEIYKWSPWRLSVKNEYDENGLVTKTTKYNDDGKTVSEVVEYTYENGVKTAETVRDKDGNLISTTTFRTENGKSYETKCDKDGNKLEETVSFKDDKGNPRTESSVYGAGGKLVSKTINYTDGNGNPREDRYEYEADGKTVASRFVKNMNADKTYSYETKYDGKGRILEQKTYKDGSYLRTAKFSYEDTSDSAYIRTTNYTDGDIKGRKVTEYYEKNKDGKFVITKSVTVFGEANNKGNVQTVYYEDGVKTKVVTEYAQSSNKGDKYTQYYDKTTKKIVKAFYYTAKTGTVRTDSYDKNGNKLKSARERISGSIKKSAYGVTVTLNAQQVYDALTSKYNSVVVSKCWGLFQWTGKQLVEEVGGKQAAEFMTMAQPGYNGTPSGASKIGDFTTNSKTKDLAGYLTEKLNQQVVEPYGYDLNKLKGYYYSSSSSLASKIKRDKYFNAFVEKYKDKLRAGYTATGLNDALAFQFKEGEMYYSFSSVNVVKSWVDSAGKLHLIIADTYDFNKSATDILNKCGAAAMEDGKLVPYYTLVEVVV